jgi:hypothetical protein
MALFILVVFSILAIIGLPIGFVLGLTALLALLKLGNPAFQIGRAHV